MKKMSKKYHNTLLKGYSYIKTLKKINQELFSY